VGCSELAGLAAGESIEKILQAYPSLTQLDVAAAIAFAAASAGERLPVHEVPGLE